MDITTATPVEIDTEIAKIHAAAEPLFTKAEYAAGAAAELARKVEVNGRYSTYSEADVTVARNKAAAAHAAYLAALEPAEPFEAEYARRPWTRAYIANVSGGHVHRSTHCSSLHHGVYMTPMGWLIELAAHTETEIVELAGSNACTVCYPSAPVDVLARTPQLVSQVDKNKTAAAAQRAVDKAARDAKKAAKAITHADGSPIKNDMGWKIATVSTLWQELAENRVNTELYNYRFETAQERFEIEGVAALAFKLDQTEDQIRETLAAKIAAKIKRDRR